MAGRKHKHKNKHPHQSNNNSQNYKVSEEQLCDLVTEATQIHELLDKRHEKLKKAEDFVYILSTKWLREWKDYVGYQQLFQEQSDSKSNKKMGKRKPGRPNSDLLGNKRQFYDIPEELEEYQYLNNVVNEKMDLNDDFIPVTDEIWQKLTELYGEGEAIRRPTRITKSGKLYVDGKLSKCDFMFLNYNQQGFLDSIKAQKNKKLFDDLMPVNKMQFSELWQVDDLFEFLRKYCLVLYNTDEIRVWVAHNFVGSGTLQQMFVDSVKDKTFKMYIKQQLKDTDYKNIDLDQIIKEQYTLIIEVGDTRISEAELPEDLHGYCESCIEKRALKYSCCCGKVFYCSMQCRCDDQNVHYNVCESTFDSDDDQQYLDKKVSKNPICGIKNLGNTCYMNSSIQLLLNVGFLWSFLGKNQYRGKISESEKGAEKFLHKISKTLKKMAESQKFGSLAPWSLKAQINYLLPPFQGYKQHDAIDFITGFIHTISQCLEKEKDQLHHQIFTKNMVGKFNSLIICPDCGMEVKNVEDFMQLHLPIKPKTNKSLFNYVIFDSPTKLTYGKGEVSHSWKQIFNTLNLKQDPILIYSGKQGQDQMLQVDRDQEAQKYFKKLKKELLIFPNQNLSEGDLIVKMIFTTTKTVLGETMRAYSGYPFPFVINEQKTTAHLYMQMVRKLYANRSEIFEEKFRAIEQQYNQIMAAEKSQKTECTGQQESKQQSDQQQNKEETELKNEKLDKQLQDVLHEIKVNICLFDSRRIKNICFYCKKKCKGCSLTPSFSETVAEFFSHKIKETILMLEFPEKIQVDRTKIDYADNGDSRLQECLKLFGEPEQLDQQNAWWCSQCEDMRLAFKQMEIIKFPQYLLIQLNRFKNGANGKVKNNEPIGYSEWQRFGGQQYHLEAAIVHEGSLEGGHYWAICYRKDGYYIFNDDKISKTQKLCNRNAYILLYKQQQQKNGAQ